MPGNNFVVNYDINVLSADAVAGINSFVAATKKLQNASANFNKLNSQINNIKNRFAALSQRAPTIQIKTGEAERKLDRLIGKLSQLEKKAKRAGISLSSVGAAGAAGGTAAGTSGAAAGAAAGRTATTVAAPMSSRKGATTPKKPRQSTRSMRHNVLGLTNIDTGGIGAFDMLKGMGIAYGISGIGTLVSNTVKEAVEYNNVMQTARNILMSHDHDPNFDSRFLGMENVVRQVGIETKFTAGEVADAAKFLAMAGFNISDINQSIRPIADIALVGDTELGETADVVTNIMTGYGISPDRVREAADVMTMTFTKSNTTLMEMAEAYKYAGSLLSLNGTSFEEATAALGILGNAGIKGSQAGTTMRTIALNIAKPTKAQAKAWEDLGISRYNADGSLRNLVDIFRDLHEKDLGLDQLGKLFHKTAASGGAALAANVEKWNEIIELNFLSDGMVGKLADAKKNTIQGLWKQVTSSFTEAGMKAFKDLEEPIRNVLNKAISLLKSDNAVKQIKEVALTIWELMGAIGKLTIAIYDLYKRFEPLILFWIKFQAVASVVLIPARSIAAVVDLIKYLGLLASSLGTASAAMVGFGTTNAAVWSRWSKATGKNIPIATGMVGSIGTGIATVGGTVLGGYLGGKIDSKTMWGPMIGGILGGAAFNQLALWSPSLWRLLKTNVLSIFASTAAKVIGGIVAALAVAGFAIYKHIKATKEATIAHNNWLKSMESINGISYSEAASKTDKYLQIVNDKQLTVNESLAKYLELRREELNLVNVEASKELVKDKLATQYKDFKKMTHRRMVQSASSGEEVLGDVISGSAITGHFRFGDHEITASDYGSNTKKAVSAVLAARAMAKVGASMNPGDPTFQLREDIQKQIFQSRDAEDFHAVMSKIEKDFEKKRSEIIPGSDKWTLEKMFEASWEDFMKSHFFVTYQEKAIRQFLNWEDGPIKAFEKLITHPDGFAAAPDSLKLALFAASGLERFKPEYGFSDLEEWHEKMGFYNGAWQSDEDKGESVAMRQGIFALEREHLASLIRSLHPNNQMGVQGFLADYIWHPEDVAKLNVGETYTVDGIKYTWNGKVWEPPKISTAATLSYSQMEALKNRTSAPGLDLSTEDGITTNTTSTEDYDTPYKSSSVTPKQIIVKIENLMNVESVDMSNPNNAAVIENLRDQMAQALIDVVADFDANANAVV